MLCQPTLCAEALAKVQALAKAGIVNAAHADWFKLYQKLVFCGEKEISHFEACLNHSNNILSPNIGAFLFSSQYVIAFFLCE